MLVHSSVEVSRLKFKVKSSHWATLVWFPVGANFEHPQLYSPLTYKHAKYLLWNIQFISAWSQKPKGVSGFLVCFILLQKDPTLLHKRPKSRFNLQGTVDFVFGVRMGFENPPCIIFRLIPFSWLFKKEKKIITLKSWTFEKALLDIEGPTRPKIIVSFTLEVLGLIQQASLILGRFAFYGMI